MFLKVLAIFLFLLPLACAVRANAQEIWAKIPGKESIDTGRRYLFYLHGAIVEGQGDLAPFPKRFLCSPWLARRSRTGNSHLSSSTFKAAGT